MAAFIKKSISAVLLVNALEVSAVGSLGLLLLHEQAS